MQCNLSKTIKEVLQQCSIALLQTKRMAKIHAAKAEALLLVPSRGQAAECWILHSHNATQQASIVSHTPQKQFVVN